MPAAPPFFLTAHPATLCGAARQLAVDVAREGAAWRLRYTLTGALARLCVPPPAARPRAIDGLWQRTCFEAFVGRADSAAYREFNFSPSGDWAAYAFHAERQRDAAPPALPAPRIACTRNAHRLTLSAWLPDSALPELDTAHALLGLCAVIETQDGSLSYWALRHPAPRPDFHHREGWTHITVSSKKGLKSLPDKR